MAKVAEKPAPPKARRLMTWVLWGVIGLLAVAAGVALPFVVSLKGVPFLNSTSAGKQKAFVNFDDITVPIKEGNSSRYVRIKMTLVMEGSDKEMMDLINKHKPFLKDWLIGYLSDKSLKELQGKAAQNRIKRDVKVQFNDRISPDGPEKISDILFGEYQIGV